MHDAEIYLRRFMKQFPDLAKWIKDTGNRALRDHYIETPYGRRRRFELITEDNFAEIKRQAVNFPIQSVASDICLRSLTCFVDTLNLELIRPIATVHDSIIFEVDEYALPRALSIIKAVMEHDELGVCEEVPLQVDIAVGHNWGDVKELTDQIDGTMIPEWDGRRSFRKLTY